MDDMIVNTKSEWVSINDIPKGENVLTPESEKSLEDNRVLSNNPVERDIEELEKQFGVKFDKEKVLSVSREALMDFVESQNSGNDLTKEDIDRMVDNMLAAVEVPEVIERKDEINQELGLTPEELKDLYKYLSGKVSTKPDFLDRYMVGSANKLIDFQHVMTLIRLSQIPQLAAMNASIQKRLYSPENLLNMDVKDLSTASASISREMSDILSQANKSIEVMNTLARVDNKYQALMDKLLVVPEDVLNQIEHLLNNYQ